MASLKFAHLLGLKKSASEEDDDKEKSKKAKSRRAEEEDRDEEDAEEEDDDTQADEDNDDTDAEEDDDDKDTSSKKSKKAKSRRAEEDDADAEEDDDKKEGRRAERKRCAAIFGSKHAANRPDMAAHLAFNTRMSAREAISTLAAMGSVSAPRRASLDERMQQAQQVRLGPDARQPASGSVEALVANATSLYNSAKGKK
ncbi:hypothetical protein QPK14_21545 [Photorhabdus temperata subsp. temperata]|uniref:Uncharacterized protein n=2 Tax=Photorhabdus temperata TaxID=574560 RepID=A0A081RS99_PHOTE|nr:hypothetical protein [Photorhabdus temperata]KER01552.1 hypothetical protein MEG1DRAFT_03843 [Photorhabdus temperata subsp. temperata Meg1]